MVSLRLQSISKCLGGSQILKDFSAFIPEKSFVGLLGPNGAGKSTLLQICAGLMEPDSGSIQRIETTTHREIQRNQIGFCTQGAQFWQGLTVLEQMFFTIELYGQSKKKLRERIDFLLESLRLTEKINSLPNQISGGEQKRLQIALSVLMNPKFLILDEPTAHLDWESRELLQSWLPALAKKEELTVLCTSHDFEDIFSLADAFIILVSGSIKWISESLTLDSTAIAEKPELTHLKEIYLQNSKSARRV